MTPAGGRLGRCLGHAAAADVRFYEREDTSGTFSAGVGAVRLTAGGTDLMFTPRPTCSPSDLAPHPSPVPSPHAGAHPSGGPGEPGPPLGT